MTYVGSLDCIRMTVIRRLGGGCCMGSGGDDEEAVRGHSHRC